MPLTFLSARPDAPVTFRHRRFSFAIEFYHSIQRNHLWLLSMFNRVFPNPLAVTPRALKRAVLEGGSTRGSTVTGPSGSGRLIGRHSITGAPVVAWTEQSFEPMCESFDDENAARIVAWKYNIQKLSLSTEDCVRRALRADQWLRGLVALITLACTMLGVVAPVIGGTTITPATLLSSAFIGMIGGLTFGLPMLLFAAVVGLLGVRFFSIISAVWVGMWAARRSRNAIVTDTAGRTSAAEIVAEMQGETPVRPTQPARPERQSQ